MPLPTAITALEISLLPTVSDEAVCGWLLEQGSLKSADLERARRLVQESDAGDLLELLARLGLISELGMARAWAATLGAPLLLADAVPPLLEALPILTERFLRHHRMVPLAFDADGVHVLSGNPANRFGFKALAYATQSPVRVSVGVGSEVNALIEQYYGQGRSAMGSLIETLDDEPVPKKTSNTCVIWRLRLR